MPDNPSTREKCAYRTIRVLPGGIVAVAHDVSFTPQVVGDLGVFPRAYPEWDAALVQVATEVDLRRELGAESRDRAERDFWVERWSLVVAVILGGER